MFVMVVLTSKTTQTTQTTTAVVAPPVQLRYGTTLPTRLFLHNAPCAPMRPCPLSDWLAGWMTDCRSVDSSFQ
jgi:hypothetical protein